MYNRFERTIEDKMIECRKFLDALADILGEGFSLIASCNRDLSAYLVPKGTEKEISYYGKPVGSFRISDHWNWLSSLKRCSDPDMVQCRSLDIPWRRKRDPQNPTAATKPWVGVQVAYYGADGCYHCVFGEKFDRQTKTWSWVENTPEDVAEAMRRNNGSI